jgi:hypothetical protein
VEPPPRAAHERAEDHERERPAARGEEERAQRRQEIAPTRVKPNLELHHERDHAAKPTDSDHRADQDKSPAPITSRAPCHLSATGTAIQRGSCPEMRCHVAIRPLSDLHDPPKPDAPNWMWDVVHGAHPRSPISGTGPPVWDLVQVPGGDRGGSPRSSMGAHAKPWTG